MRLVDADQLREHLAGEDDDDAEQEAHRDEERRGVLEVGLEALAASLALGLQPEREVHQRTERRLDGADVHRTAREQEQPQRDHRAARSIRPDVSPALRRNRASARRIVPSSVSWS